MEPTDHNLRAWEEAHRRPPGPPPGLPEPVRRSLADLHGKRILHVRCGSGEATVELVGLGALVTGVEALGEALEAARQRMPSVLWVQAEADALPPQLRRGRFDLVYAGPGLLAEPVRLDAFAHGAAQALRSGGDLLLYDEHPVARCVDPMLRWREDYFEEGRRRLGHVVAAAAAEGLVARALEEYPGAERRVPGSFLLHARKVA
jgi:SAM-dependent methyltransferase